MTRPRGPARRSLLCAIALLLPATAGAALPTAAQVAEKMSVGWNIGNSLEVPGGETGWGNPKVSRTLIDAVKAAGFDAVRLPCAWDSHADATTHVIDPAWLARVKEVVDDCVANGMYVVLNIHWDGGWLENHPTSSSQASVNAKQRTYWTQIATYFRDYDEHLLFAGTNEVNVNWAPPTAENIAAQQSYLQTFVDAVRATGGNNATRTLAVQTYSTNIGFGLDSFTLPRDTATDRLLVEVHFYDPYDYTANEQGTCMSWGAPYPAQSACAWAQESWLDDRFAKVKARWVDRGVPVIVGEYGVVRRTSLGGQQLATHLASRRYYLEYLNAAARKNGVKTFYWDNGHDGANGFALFDRNSGAVVDQGGVDAILKGAGVAKPGVSYTLTATVAGSGSVTRDPDRASYAAGTVVTLRATPAGGHEFAGWSGDLAGLTNPATLTVTRNAAVTATFVLTQIDPEPGQTTHALGVTKAGTGSGSVTSSPAGLACGATCTADYSAGTSVTLTATPEGGSEFAGWGGACSGAGTCTVAMTAARSVTASFGAITAADVASPGSPPLVTGTTGCSSGAADGGLGLLLAPAVALLVRRARRPS